MNKTQELGRFLLGKSGSIDFIEPSPNLMRSDSQELRKRVLELSAREARRLGISKSTLHYLRKNAASYLSFDIYRNVREKLAQV